MKETGSRPALELQADDLPEFISRRRARLWYWPTAAAVLVLLELVFLLWLAANFPYLLGCWDVMRTMELGALDVAPWQTLSIMIPIWVSLGTFAYTFAIYMILKAFAVERRYLKALADDRDIRKPG